MPLCRYLHMENNRDPGRSRGVAPPVGVITALTIALIPAAMLLLEGLLNFVQALIFSTLMLMYTIIAVESHHTEEHPAVADVHEGGMAPPLSAGATSH